MKHPIVLAPAGILSAGLTTGCASQSVSPGAAATKTTAAAGTSRAVCTQQAAWAKRGDASVQALYADTGAVSADSKAGNTTGVARAGRTLTSGAVAHLETGASAMSVFSAAAARCSAGG